MEIGKQIIQWMIALICGFMLVNIICFVYERPVGWLNTENGASVAVRKPHSLLIHGTEGYGITRIDANGYTNPDLELNDTYILMMGSSHTQGKEVFTDKKYPVLVNNYLTNDQNGLSTYSIACDGNFLPEIIKHFNSAVAAFPDAVAITIEIGSTDYSIEELDAGINQTVVDQTETAQLFDRLNIVDKLKINIKECFPLLSWMKNQWEIARVQNAGNAMDDIDTGDYEKTINQALALIRSEYDGTIVFLYHPGTSIMDDGTLKLEYSQTWDIFQKACIQNGIDVIDMGADFAELYQTTYKLPYGFSNSTPGSGHLNATGHQIMAEALISYLEEQNQ